MKKIKLTQGQFAIVDNEDYQRLNKFKWFAIYDPHIKNYYAGRQSHRDKNGKHYIIRMHRFIMNTPKGMHTDHKNRNSLDNRKFNLRICTNSQNNMNRRPLENCSSQFKGVGWHKKGKSWRAIITINSKSKEISGFKNEIEAAKAYNSMAKKYFGEFALLNKLPSINNEINRRI